MSNTLTPLEAPFPAEIEARLSAFPAIDGYYLSLFRSFALSERFLAKAVPNLLDSESPIDLRTREIVILRTTSNRGCEYEWGVHVAFFAEAAGFSQEQVASTKTGDLAPWSDAEGRLLNVVDQLCEPGNLDAESLAGFQSEWSNEQQLEIMALVGTYTTVSLVANVAELPLEAFSARFPS